MSSFRYGKPTTNAYSGRRSVVGSVKSRNSGEKRFTVEAENTSGGSSYHNNRFNPVFDRLEQGSVLEDWVPRDAPGINMMFRRIHLRDAIAGPTVDIYATLPWSEFDIIGIEDPNIRRFYQEAFSMFTPETMTYIAKEFLVIGRLCASLSFNGKRGYFDNFSPHDPDTLEIRPVPWRGFDPIIDIRLNKPMKEFLSSQDDRIRRIRALLPRTFVEKFDLGNSSGQGRIPLEPLTTMFLARRISPFDHVGTSFLTRIVSMWAIEKALMDATVTAARRRAGNLMHITAGIDGVWEPDPTEIDNIASLFVQAEEDPVGAVVATRTGVTANEVRQGGQVWKVSDEWAFLSESKMRALGVSEALLSGDATFSNMETSRSLMVEQILAFRQQLTDQIFQKIGSTLARTHGFTLDKKRANSNGQIRVAPGRAESSYRHAVRLAQEARLAYANNEINDEEYEAFKRQLKKSPMLDDAMRIPTEQLITPKVQWRKDMKPRQDEAYFELLEKLEDKGLPVPLKMWAVAGDYDIDAAIEMMPEDAELRNRLAQLGGGPDMGAGDGMDGLGDEGGAMDDMGGPGLGPDGGEPDGLDKLIDQDNKARQAREGGPDSPVRPDKPGGPDKPKRDPVSNPAPPSEVKPRSNPMAIRRAVEEAPFWRDGKLLGLKRETVLSMVDKVAAHPEVLKDGAELRALIKASVKKEKNAEVAAFVWHALGLPPSVQISAETTGEIATELAQRIEDPQALMHAMIALSTAAGVVSPVGPSSVDNRAWRNVIVPRAKAEAKISPKSINLLGGVNVK